LTETQSQRHEPLLPRTELIAAYRLPQHVHDQLFAEIVSVDKDSQIGTLPC